MGWVVRLIEKLTGTPHRHDNAKMVSDAAGDLTASIRELSATLRPYRDSSDPLEALMTDVMKKRRRERNDGQSKFHS